MTSNAQRARSLGGRVAVMPDRSSGLLAAHSDIEILGAVPLMAKIPHDESAIELYASSGKPRVIGEVARVHFIHLERLNTPAVRPKLETVEAAFGPRHGVANGPRLEEGGGLGQGREGRGARETVG